MKPRIVKDEKSKRVKAAGFILVTLILMTLIFVPQTAANITTTLGVLYVNSKLEELNEKINKLAYLDMKLSMINASLGLLSSAVKDLNRQVMMLNTLVSNINAWILGWESTWMSFKAEYNAFKSQVEEDLEQISLAIMLAVAELEQEIAELENLVRLLYGAVVPIHYSTLSDAVNAGETRVALLNVSEMLYAPGKSMHLTLLNSSVTVLAVTALQVDGKGVVRLFAGVEAQTLNLNDVALRVEGRVSASNVTLNKVSVTHWVDELVTGTVKITDCTFTVKPTFELELTSINEAEIKGSVFGNGATLKIYSNNSFSTLRIVSNTFSNMLNISRFAGQNPRYIQILGNRFTAATENYCMHLSNITFTVINDNIFQVSAPKTGLNIINGDRLTIVGNIFMAYGTTAINGTTSYSIITNNQIIGTMNVTGTGNTINNNLS